MIAPTMSSTELAIRRAIAESLLSDGSTAATVCGMPTQARIYDFAGIPPRASICAGSGQCTAPTPIG